MCFCFLFSLQTAIINVIQIQESSVKYDNLQEINDEYAQKIEEYKTKSNIMESQLSEPGELYRAKSIKLEQENSKLLEVQKDLKGQIVELTQLIDTYKEWTTRSRKKDEMEISTLTQKLRALEMKKEKMHENENQSINLQFMNKTLTNLEM